MTVSEGRDALWTPQPKQALLLACPYDEILYGGAAGGGKTDAVIGKALAHCAQWGRWAKVLILRKQIGHFREILGRMKALLYPVLGKQAYNKDERTWTLPNQALIMLGYLEHEDDVEQYQGGEFTLVEHDELTQWPTPDSYNWLWSRLRSPNPEIPLQRVATSNPGGAGHVWVKKLFIDPVPPGTPNRVRVVLPDGSIEEKTRIFIPSRVQDNKFLGRKYIANLMNLTPAMRARYLDGDWNIVDGAFFSTWDRDLHVCESFPISSDWEMAISMDWGTGHPYAILYIARSPYGEEYIAAELYGQSSDPDAPYNTGTGETPYEVARRMLQLEESLGWGNRQFSAMWADGSIFDRHGGPSIAEQFAEAFRQLGRRRTFQPSYKANKASGLLICKKRLTVINGRTTFKVFSRCVHFIRTVPALQCDKTNPEIYEKKSENHLADAWLYAEREISGGEDETRSINRVKNYNLKRSRMYASIQERFGD